jgi:transposase
MFFGALCPLASMVSGSCDDILGGASYVSPFGRLLSSTHSRACGLFFTEVGMANRKGKSSSHSKRSARPKKLKMVVVPDDLQITHAHAAGIDVHSREHWVAVPVSSARVPAKDHPAHLPAHVRKFGTCTADLELLADWLRECGVTTVAMESTGVYWVPLFELLERRGFEVFLVDPRQTRQVSGRPKTDVLDCQWIQRLHSYGLLAPSFRPSDEVCVLRGYLRQRQMLIGNAARSIQHIQKALEQMNIKLTEAVSDVTGVTGMLILKAILRGERDPKRLAEYRHDNCKQTEEQIARALQGNWREEHLFALKQAVKAYEFERRQLKECDAAIEKYLKRMEDKSGGEVLAPKPTKGKNATTPTFDARTLLFQASGKDLTLIEGIDQSSALTILSEIGFDMSKWATEKHFTSWLGLCPQHRGSAGKIKNRRLRGGANRAARAFRMSAQGCHHAKNAMGAFYRRVRSHAGAAKALVATARKIAERVYRLMKYGEGYVRQAMDAYENAYRLKLTKGLAKKAAELGYKLIPNAEAAPLA